MRKSEKSKIESDLTENQTQGTVIRESSRWIPYLLIAFIIAIVYAESCNAPFYYDDYPIITTNSNIHASELSFSDIISDPVHGPGHLRPLPMITFAMNFYAGRLNPYGYHIVNIALHIAAAIALFILLRLTLQLDEQISDNREDKRVNYTLIAFWSVLIWAISPLHTNSVTYIVQRMNIMAMLFSVISLILYIKGRIVMKGEKGRETKHRSLLLTVFFGGSVISFLAALLSKQNAVMLPLFILLYEWFFFQNLKPPARKKSIIIILLFISGIILLSYLWFGTDPIEIVKNSYTTRDFSLKERVLTEMRIVWYYVSLIFIPLPSRMHLVYNYPLSSSLFSPWTTFTSLAGLFLCGALVFKGAKKYRLAAFSLIWFFGNNLIESSFIGLEPVYEYRTYMPSAFIFLPLVLLFYQYSRKQLFPSLILALFAIFSIYGTIERNKLWNNPEQFWADNLKKAPKNSRVMLNYAKALANSGQTEKAKIYYRKILHSNTDSSPYSSIVHNNLGEILAAEHNFGDAEKHLQKAIELDPAYSAAYFNLGAVMQDTGRFSEAMKYYRMAEKHNQDNPVVLSKIASLYREQKDFKSAISLYRKALEISPGMLNASLDLGLIYMKSDNFDDAETVYNNALKYHPSSAAIQHRLGLIAMHRKRYDEALIRFQNVLILNQEFPGIRQDIADVNSLRGKSKDAIKTYQEILKQKPDDYTVHNNLGLLFLKKGDFLTAEKHFKTALELKPDMVEAMKNMGNIMFIKKRYDDASGFYIRAAEITPGDPSLYHNLGSVYASQGKFEKAVEAYHKALKIKPDYYEAKLNLKRVMKHLNP